MNDSINNNDTRRNVSITLFDEEQYDGDWVPEKLIDAVKWLQSHLDSVPKQYRDSVEIVVDSAGGYEGCHYGHIAITYCRPESDEEMEGRIERQRVTVEDNKRRDLEQLARLKARYEQ